MVVSSEKLKGDRWIIERLNSLVMTYIMYAVSEWICQNVASTYYVYDGSSKRKKKAPRELPRGVSGRVTELCFSMSVDELKE
jgi:hypothetical protein